MAVQALPGTHYNASTLSEDTLHFHRALRRVGKEHQSELARYQVKALIGEWELLSRAGTPFNRQALLFRRCASRAEHMWIEIEAGDFSLRPDAPCDVPGDDPRPARHIQDMLARLHIRNLDQFS